MKENELTFFEKAISAVANPNCLSILQEILDKGTIRCSDVVSLTGLSQHICTHHIKLLAESERIECRKEEPNNFFTLNKNNFKKSGNYFEHFSS